VIKKVAVYHEKKVDVPKPYEVIKKVPYEVKVPVDKPYNVEVPKPYPVWKEVKVPYTVEKKVSISLTSTDFRILTIIVFFL
jgi:hypothetical protein